MVNGRLHQAFIFFRDNSEFGSTCGRGESLRAHFLVVRVTWYILHIFYAKLFHRIIES